MMRCKRHPSDLSSSVGVCATCLRESLFSLIAAQARQQAVAAAAQAEEEDRRKSDAHHPPPPPPLIFPRSVSPYICRRSDDSSWSHNQHNDRRFYSTPQVGPTFSSTTTTVHSCSTTTTKKKKHTSKFSLFSSLFKSTRSVEAETDPTRVSKGSPLSSPISSAASSSSSSWFSSLLSSRRKKQSRFCSQDETTIHPPAANLHRTRRRRDRGMSPSDREEYMEEEAEGSPSASGYSSESSQGWRKSGSMRTPARRKGGGTHNRNVSGMAFCLSPLVRASPNRHRNQKDGGLPASMVFSGEIGRGGSKCHLSTAASLCANRSRKLADFGRYNYNP